MSFNAPDLNVFKADLDASLSSIEQLNATNHATIKIQSLLNLTAYALTARFLEGSVKHILFNCCKMRGDTTVQLESLISALKGFNNPEFKHIKTRFQEIIGFDVAIGIAAGHYSNRDVTFLDQIIQNRHANVHATPESAEWYNTNRKNIINLRSELPGLLKVLNYLDSIIYDSSTTSFRH